MRKFFSALLFVGLFFISTKVYATPANFVGYYSQPYIINDYISGKKVIATTQFRNQNPYGGTFTEDLYLMVWFNISGSGIPLRQTGYGISQLGIPNTCPSSSSNVKCYKYNTGSWTVYTNDSYYAVLYDSSNLNNSLYTTYGAYYYQGQSPFNYGFGNKYINDIMLFSNVNNNIPNQTITETRTLSYWASLKLGTYPNNEIYYLYSSAPCYIWRGSPYAVNKIVLRCTNDIDYAYKYKGIADLMGTLWQCYVGLNGVTTCNTLNIETQTIQDITNKSNQNICQMFKNNYTLYIIDNINPNYACSNNAGTFSYSENIGDSQYTNSLEDGITDNSIPTVSTGWTLLDNLLNGIINIFLPTDLQRDQMLDTINATINDLITLDDMPMLDYFSQAINGFTRTQFPDYNITIGNNNIPIPLGTKINVVLSSTFLGIIGRDLLSFAVFVSIVMSIFFKRSAE